MSNLNQIAWETLFKRYKILEEVDKNGIFYISADQIKKEREPRLMAKFDHTINLPPIFAKNKLSILPITRGDYAIAHFDAYHPFEDAILECKNIKQTCSGVGFYNSPTIQSQMQRKFYPLNVLGHGYNPEIHQVSMPSYIQSIDSNNITSETVALNCAVATGIIADFTEDFNILPTVSGRMGSGYFNFNIKDVITKKTLNIDVKNSQIEIDAAYEGVNYLSLFEAKRDISDDFLVRQLYYPYRSWQGQVTKPVKPIFLVYSNGIYRLYEYRFTNPDEYSSLTLVKQKNYSIEDTEITTEDIINVMKNTKIKAEPSGVPFPQADKFERIINLCELLNSGDYDRNQVTQNYDFDGRQTNYYISAGIYLGLIEKYQINRSYQLSKDGKKILKLNYKQRQLAYCERILSHNVFHKVAQLYFQRGNIPERSEVIDIMKSFDLYNVKAESTYFRRSSTVMSWVEWIAKLIQSKILNF